MNKELAVVVYAEARQLKLPLGSLAAMIGVDASSLRNLFCARSGPRKTYIEKIAKVLPIKAYIQFETPAERGERFAELSPAGHARYRELQLKKEAFLYNQKPLPQWKRPKGLGAKPKKSTKATRTPLVKVTRAPRRIPVDVLGTLLWLTNVGPQRARLLTAAEWLKQNGVHLADLLKSVIHEA